ncbi:tryptophanyl-tRNA synthetase [Mycoplasma ovis str. Michigan]|uniref:Tryptophan--tRNA ligase n=1 Tax=Mycoplasma ovis str. Michigan TaxID=1415773 RepID=A0ABM5P153_9MOLU|nr:tryptophan--tRNA ligase [Mycoplasma ovis]AHC40051.1 tryptophanyl-tRNA synthetase [Mycoplasma ovis str. Michigan]
MGSNNGKPVLICGIQPTSTLTLGNYIGSLLPLIKNQNSFDSILLIADLHSYTIPLSIQNISFQTIKKRSWELIKWIIASGVDTTKTRIVLQSDLKAEHLELFYFLLTHSKLGELQIMTQYKFLMNRFKEPNGTEPNLFGVLIYPVLMAADILIYDSQYLSVGEDQTQHLELCSELRTRINKLYNCNIFPNKLSAINLGSGTKIMDLVDPTKKMSKSTTNKDGVIFVSDSPEEITKKIMRAKTDSLNQISLDKNQAGIHNLLSIYSSLSDQKLEQVFESVKSLSYKELKEQLSKLVVQKISSIQERYSQIEEQKIKEILKKNADYLRQIARKKLDLIYSTVGMHTN